MLQPFAGLPQPEVALRVPSLAFSSLTLWFAWLLGGRLAGHPLGGAFAVALVALDPAAIQYAKQLEQYSAETAVMLGTLWVTTMVAEGRARLWSLVAALVCGLVLSNAQLLTAPAVLVALASSSEVRGEIGLTRLIVAGTLVGACCAAYYLLLVRPWSNGAMHAFWMSHHLPTDIRGALAGAVHGFRKVLAPGLGPSPIVLSLAGISLAMRATIARPAALAVVLVAGQMVLLATLQMLPIGVARTSLFLTNAILVVVGAAAARGVVALWRSHRLRTAAPAAALAFAAIVLRGRPWTTMADVEAPEDLGPLVQAVEAARRPGERILLYDQSRATTSAPRRSCNRTIGSASGSFPCCRTLTSRSWMGTPSRTPSETQSREAERCGSSGRGSCGPTKHGYSRRSGHACVSSMSRDAATPSWYRALPPEPNAAAVGRPGNDG